MGSTFSIAIVVVTAVMGGEARVDGQVCGRTALGLVAAYYGALATANDLDDLLPDEEAPYSFADLQRAAEELGFEAFFVRWIRKEEARFDCPAILRIRARPESQEPDHFVASFGTSGDAILIADFPRDPVRVPIDRLFRLWDGEMLYMEQTSAPVISQLRAARRGSIVAQWGYVAFAAAAMLALGVRLRLWWRRPAAKECVDPSYLVCMPPKRAAAVLFVVIVAATAAVLAHRRGRPAATTIRNGGPLVADRDLLVVQPKDATETGRVVAFELRNASDRDVVIKHVSSKCSCVAVTPLDETTLAPGGATKLELKIAIPKMGQAARAVNVYHNGSDEPLTLQVQVRGRKSLPFIVRTMNDRPTFNDLANDSSPQTVLVETREEAGSLPWFTDLVCDNDKVAVEFDGFAETPAPEGNVVVRKYSWTIGWTQVPAPGELSARLSVTIAEKGEKTIAYLFARVSGNVPFSPSTVHLQRATKERELVVVNRAAGGRHWTVPRNFSLPTWVTVMEASMQDRQAFEFRLAPTAPKDGVLTEAIPIEDTDGATHYVRVIADGDRPLP